MHNTILRLQKILAERVEKTFFSNLTRFSPATYDIFSIFQSNRTGKKGTFVLIFLFLFGIFKHFNEIRDIHHSYL